MKIEENLKKLNIELPKAPKPVGSYAAFKIVNNLIFISGQISLKPNGELIKGKVGLNLSLEQGQEAAQVCAVNILSQIKSACNGDLDKVTNIGYWIPADATNGDTSTYIPNSTVKSYLSAFW